MSEQYFQAAPTSAHDVRRLAFTLNGRLYLVETDAGVFSRDGLDEGSALLLDAVLPHLKGRVLDLGCGWGAVGLVAATQVSGLEVVMTDINGRAVELARRNLDANRARATLFCGDGLDAVQGDFDWILLNPPIRAGKQAVYKLFSDSAARLNTGGTLAIVIRKQQGALSAKAFLDTIFGSVSLIGRKKGYHIYFCGRDQHEV